jgi:hypothetical protein
VRQVPPPAEFEEFARLAVARADPLGRRDSHGRRSGHAAVIEELGDQFGHLGRAFQDEQVAGAVNDV